ncbi:MAG: hypothetical protein M3Q71_14115 [Chloroflexota bacterium]|nr:hypothetical protein [Chloroflexota bacterium]
MPQADPVSEPTGKRPPGRIAAGGTGPGAGDPLGQRSKRGRTLATAVAVAIIAVVVTLIGAMVLL